MNTDALREALEKIAENTRCIADAHASGESLDRLCIHCIAFIALAAPASETEKLPAKWRAEAEKCCPSKFEPCNSCKQQLEDATELEAALKADRQGE